MARSAYNDWRVWLIVIFIILLIFWLFYSGENAEFIGVKFSGKPNLRPPKPAPKRNRMTSQGEEHCRKIFEDHYQRPFPPVRDLEWLKSPKTNRYLELDGYCADLGIAFEFNGRQHYEFVSTYHKCEQDLIDQVSRDQFKKQACRDNNVWLISIPYNIPKSKRRNFILERLPENIINTNNKGTRINF